MGSSQDRTALLARARGLSNRAALAPARYVLVAYAALILFGTAALSLPQASAMERPLTFVEALFTAASAVCVTGLTVVSTAHDLSLAGQLIVLALLQIGALGIMTISTFFLLLFGKRVSLTDRLLLQQDLKSGALSGLIRLVRHVVTVTFAVEAAGAAVLYFALPDDLTPARAAYLAVFHAVSAFANGGFDLFGESLAGVPFRIPFGTALIALTALGGLGFTVLEELRSYRPGRRLSLHTRVVLRATAWLLGLGCLLSLLLEWNNPATLAPMHPAERAWHALFLSAMTRSGGFSSVPTAGLSESTLFLCMILMFIGAAPGSTGGGIKTTTAATIWAGVRSSIAGRLDVSIANRRLPEDALAKAVALVVLAALTLLGAVFILTLTEDAPFLATLFEAVSAFGTAGLSTGAAASFSAAGKIVLVLLMLVGRIGPLTFALALSAGEDGPGRVRLPEERLPLG